MTKEELIVLMADVVRPMYKIEKDIGMPMNTLQRAMKGTKDLPKKWAVKLKGYIERKEYLTADLKNPTTKPETTQIKDLNQQTTGTTDLTKEPPKSNYTINTTDKPLSKVEQLRKFRSG